MTNHEERVAVVVGASSGVGKAVAVDLARKGWRLALIARRRTLLDDVVASIRADGGSAVARTVDVVSWSDDDGAWVRDALADHDDVALVYAAGVFGPVGLVGTVPLDQWRRTIDANLFGALAASSAVLPVIREQGRGRLVFVSSAQTQHAPDPVVTAYATSKQALNFLAASLATELRGTQAAAVCVHPGDLKTEMWAEIAASAEAAGPVGEPLRRWAASVGASGGDLMEAAVHVVVRALDDAPEAVNGKFLMPRDGSVAHPGSGDRALWGGVDG